MLTTNNTNNNNATIVVPEKDNDIVVDLDVDVKFDCGGYLENEKVSSKKLLKTRHRQQQQQQEEEDGFTATKSSSLYCSGALKVNAVSTTTTKSSSSNSKSPTRVSIEHEEELEKVINQLVQKKTSPPSGGDHDGNDSSEDDDDFDFNYSNNSNDDDDDDDDDNIIPTAEQAVLNHPCHTLAESVIAKQLSQLSMKDREEVYYDIHGVSDVMEETTEFLDQKLSQLAMELESIDASLKKAYLMACSTNPAYVQNKEFQLRFLRADRFNVQLAAQRYVSHYKVKLELFGMDKLTRDITQDDMGNDSEVMESLYSESNQLLPMRDRAGRAIWFYVSSAQQQSYSAEVALKRRFYNAMLISEDVETQRKGLVMIVYAVGQRQNRRNRTSANVLWKMCDLMRSLPTMTICLHFCYDNVSWLPVVAITRWSLSWFTRLRFRTHLVSSHHECMYILQTFGIPTEAIPLDENGKISMGEDFKNLLVGRRRSEQEYLKRLAASSSSSSVVEDSSSPPPSDSNNNNNNNNNNNKQKINTPTKDSKKVEDNKEAQTPSEGAPDTKKDNDDDNDNTTSSTTATSTGGASASPPPSSSSAFLTDFTNKNNKSTTIIIPSRFDVLLGRGKGFFNHIGNIRYRAMIEDLRGLYDQTSSTIDKKQITSEVVQSVQASGGRFLKRNTTKGNGSGGGGGWIHVDDETARLKVSHSFRALRTTTTTTNANNNSTTSASSTTTTTRPIGSGGDLDGNNNNTVVNVNTATPPSNKRMRRD